MESWRFRNSGAGSVDGILGAARVGRANTGRRVRGRGHSDASRTRRSQPNKHLPRFEPGVVIGPAIDEHASHHEDLARSKRRLRLRSASDRRARSAARAGSRPPRIRVPRAFASRLAHERDTPSCRATAATVMPAVPALAREHCIVVRGPWGGGGRATNRLPGPRFVARINNADRSNCRLLLTLTSGFTTISDAILASN